MSSQQRPQELPHQRITSAIRATVRYTTRIRWHGGIRRKRSPVTVWKVATRDHPLTKQPPSTW